MITKKITIAFITIIIGCGNTIIAMENQEEFEAKALEKARKQLESFDSKRKNSRGSGHFSPLPDAIETNIPAEALISPRFAARVQRQALMKVIRGKLSKSQDISTDVMETQEKVTENE